MFVNRPVVPHGEAAAAAGRPPESQANQGLRLMEADGMEMMTMIGQEEAILLPLASPSPSPSLLLPTPLGIKGAELTSQVLAVPGRVKHDTASVHLALAHLALSAPAKKKKQKKKEESIQNGEREVVVNEDDAQQTTKTTAIKVA